MRLHLLVFVASVAVVAAQRAIATDTRPSRVDAYRSRAAGSRPYSERRAQPRRRGRVDDATAAERVGRQGRRRRGQAARAESTRRTSARTVPGTNPWPKNCTRCEERQDIKRWRLELIKAEILQKLRLKAPPNITSQNIPDILNETLHPYLQMDATYSDQAAEGDDFHATKLKIMTIGHPPPPSLGINESHVCFFAFQTDVKRATIMSAQFYVYIRPTTPSDASTWILIYKYIPPDGSGTKARRPFIGRQQINLDRTATGTWYSFDVKNVVRSWVRAGEESFGIEVEAFNHQGQSLAVISPMYSDEEKYKPFVEVRIYQSNSRPKRMLGLECDDFSTEERCCRYPLVVDFVEFNWDWIIAPKRYRANFCSGECGYVFFQKYPHTHIITQTKPGGGAGPCCNPTKVSPIPLLYFNDRYNVIHGTLPGMVVDRCGCS